MYCDQNKKEIRKIKVLVKRPDTTYSIGADGRLTNQIALMEVRRKDINDPKIGDYIRIGKKYYKIFEQPLQDSSNMLWKIDGIENNV
ncbi:MAG: hypothetical protein QWI36_03690 [Wolbachia endosymbiont of Tyrophagus putrescentiae]|nr:hypothetical protein [Wolbachia endosymbiont of Tyrophagus putrescentiae]